jgi:UDP-N-acetylmuramyl pentapeptide phosphotransferase/UDP-N-acetylglucosamine-1-phosphate transferase
MPSGPPRIIAPSIASAAHAGLGRQNGRKQQLAEAAPVCQSCIAGRGTAMTGLAAIIAATVSWLTLRVLLRRSGLLPLDRPNARSLHVHPVPRGGGLAIWAGWFAGTLWLPGAKPWLGPLFAVIAISLLDDHRGIHPAIRLCVQGAAAAAWVWLAGAPVNTLVAILGIVWMANLYNFMDGSDGLAGAMTVVGFTAYAAAAWLAGGAGAALLLALAAATVPFLAANLPPARVILGDVGAVPLGFLAAVFGLEGWQAQWWPAWFPVLVFLPFIADATVTLCYRLLRGARVWEAHREHHYQHLVQSGYGHGRTLALYVALMVGVAGSGLAVLAWAPSRGLLVVIGWGAVLALVFAAIEYYWRRRGVRFDESKG